MTNPLKSDFDGTWRFVNEKEDEGWNYLHFSRGNRIVQFYNIKDGTYQDGKMLVGDAGNQKIEFFPQDGSEGWTRGYRFDDGNLVIVEGDMEFPCERISEMAPWLKEGITKADSYFDEHEATWGKKE